MLKKVFHALVSQSSGNPETIRQLADQIEGGIHSLNFLAEHLSRHKHQTSENIGLYIQNLLWDFAKMLAERMLTEDEVSEQCFYS